VQKTPGTLMDKGFSTKRRSWDFLKIERGQWVSATILIIYAVHHETQKSFLHH